ncbi:MAG: DUF4838 domain-containing protein [Armatimonadota bacterium]|nr:DUF4838 domain-containing protein [Armatimonadota bacterium]
MLILLVLAALLGSSCAVADQAVLADGGGALMPIVLHHEATDRQRELADELAGYLQRISRAEFEVQAGGGSSGIVLGTPEQFPVPEWREELAVEGHEALEAFGIRTGPERVLLIGATDLGLDRAITRLLMELGCRWLWPSEAWHVVPQRDRLVVDLDLTDRPAMLSRVIWWDWGPWDQQAREDWERWMRRNLMGESLKIRCGHAWQRIIAERRAQFDEHPEYLAYRPEVDEETGEATGGTRGGNKLCVTNPELVELCRDYAVDYFDERPEEDMVSLEPSDGGGHCQCPDCLAMGPIPQRVHWLTNQVARAVAEHHPGKLVGTYAYHLHSEPPSFVMEPNVYVQITAGFTRGQYSFLELIEQWHEHVSQLGIYEYLNVWAWSRDMPGASRGANVEYLAERIPYYAEHGATTMSCESGANYGPNGLGYLVASRLMWDPEADVEAICSDFYQKAFGPAAEPMRRYFERLDGGNEPLVSDHLLALAHQDLAEASRLAADRPDVLRRIDDLKLYLHYVGLMRELNTPQEDQERLETLFDLLTFAYRTRHRYIVHSTGIRGRYATYYLRGIEQPEDWDWRNKGAETAWYTGEDYTHQEVEAIFQRGLQRYEAKQFERRSFSDDLVPVDFEAMPGAPRCRQIFQGSREFVFYSDGAPLQLRLQTGWIAHYRDRRPTRWQVAGWEGEPVGSGELPLDGEWHELSVQVPAAGRYRLHVDDAGAGWQIDYAPGTPAVWPLEKGRRIYGLGGTTAAVYFYVPAGTERVAYYVEGTAHSVLDGDGNTVAELEAEPGEVITVEVPEGQDGRVWCLRDLKFRRLWFYNCPNYLAALAQDMMVPRELVE